MMVIINADVMAVRPQVGPIRPIAFGANFRSIYYNIYFIIHVARRLRVSDLLSIVRAGVEAGNPLPTHVKFVYSDVRACVCVRAIV